MGILIDNWKDAVIFFSIIIVALLFIQFGLGVSPFSVNSYVYTRNVITGGLTNGMPSIGWESNRILASNIPFNAP